jgi:hypothetical protein
MDLGCAPERVGRRFDEGQVSRIATQRLAELLERPERDVLIGAPDIATRRADRLLRNFGRFTVSL